MSKQTNTPEQDVIIEGHDYDGILEYDNPMPRWWLAIFGITVVWSGYYVLGISMGWINTYEKDLAAESEIIDAQQAAWRASQIPVDQAYLEGKRQDPAIMAAGKAAFDMNCAACHGFNGEGMIGPNLTDDYWLHGGALMDIYNVANDGVLDKGMPAWGALLTHEELIGTVAYIDSLRGSNPANAKAAQGELWTAPEAPAEDAPVADSEDAPSDAENAEAAEEAGEAAPADAEAAPAEESAE